MAVDDGEMCEYEKVFPITYSAAVIAISPEFVIVSCNLSLLPTLPLNLAGIDFQLRQANIRERDEMRARTLDMGSGESLFANCSK